MRPLSFRSDTLRALLLRNQIATLDELKQTLGTPVDVTVFRKLKPLDYLTRAGAKIISQIRSDRIVPPRNYFARGEAE